MPVEFDETLRGLQKLIKSQKGGGGTAKKSKFKRQTYRQIIQLRYHLRDALKLYKKRKALSKEEQKKLPALPLETLQVHCEKLLHAVLMLLQEQLTSPLRTLIAECYGLLYLAGRTRTLFDTLARWVEILNDKKTDRHVSCTVLHSIEMLFKTQGTNVSSYFQDVLTACGKQMRLSDIQVKRATVMCVFEVINSCGYAGKHSHLAALKFLTTASKDKSSEIRVIVGSALEALAMATNIFDSLPLDNLMALAMRGVDDLSPKVRLAYGRAIGTMMTISILNPVEPGSIKKVETRKLSLGTKKKPPMNFSLPSAVSYLCAQLNRSTSKAGKLGIAKAMIEVVRHPSTSDISMTKEVLPPLISKILSLMKPTTSKVSSTDSHKDYMQALTSYILRNAIVYQRPEHHLILISQMILHKLKPKKVDKLDDLQIVVLLSALSHLLSALGDAAGGIGADCRNVLSDLVVHPAHAVRLETATCARSFMAAIPALGSKLLDELVENMVKNHGDLITIAMSKKGRKKPSKKEQVEVIQLLIGLRGRSMAVAALLFAVPACSLGVPRSTVNTVLYLSTALLHQYNDDALLATAASACARAGWTLIMGIIALGPLTVRPHLHNIISVLKEVCRARSPHSLNAATSMSELEVVATAMCALTRLVASWPTLANDDAESMEECVICVLNVVSALSPPLQSLSNLANSNSNTKTISTSFLGGSTNKSKQSKNVKADIMFITLYATSLEACALLPVSETLARALPSLVQSTVTAFVDGLYGQTSLLDCLPLLDSGDASLQIGERKWPGIPRCRGEDIHFVSDVDVLEEPIALSLDSAYVKISLIEQEFALINAMAWAVPIIANGAGRGSDIVSPRRSWRPVDCSPSPFAIQRHVDAAIGLFAVSFPALSPEARTRLLDGFKKSIKAADNKSSTTTAFAVRNIFAAMLGASKSLVAFGTKVNIFSSSTATNGSSNVLSSSRGQWKSTCKGLLITALRSRDSLVRRAAAEGIGYMALAITDMSFAKSVEKSLHKSLEVKDSSNNNEEDMKHYRAGAIFALACIRRRLGSMYRSSVVPDNFFYHQSREISQPIRTWGLHSFWIVINSVGVGFEKYVKPTMALVDAHLLAGRISETSREREPYADQINAGVLLCLGRLINSVVGGMGPELLGFAESGRMKQLWSCWEELKESNFEVIQEECLFYVEQVAMFCPKDLGLIDAMPWILDNLINGSLLIQRKACNCIRRIVEREPKLVFALAPYLFYTLDRSQAAVEVAPSVMAMGGFGLSSTIIGSHNIVPPLNSVDGVGLLRMRHQTSPRGRDPDASMSRQALVQNVREVLLDMIGLDTSCTRESTSRWFNILRSVIISSSSNSGDGDDEDNEDTDDDDEEMKKEKEKRKKEIDERKKLKLEAEKKSPYNQIAELYEVPLEPDFWPLNGIRWQSKNVALECLQKLLQLARLSEFSEKHFNMPSEKENSNSSNSKKEKKRKKKLIEDAKKNKKSPEFLIYHLRELVKLACVMSTSSVDGGELYQIQTRGISFIGDIIEMFANSKDPKEPKKSILLQYEAQINSALRPCFKKGSYPPLTIQACRSVSSLISLGISTDLAMARRAVKTLLADIDLQKTVRPPKPEEHQEHITMCKLLARLTALGTLQASTLEPQMFVWNCCESNDTVMNLTSSSVSVDMRKALSKALKDILPQLRNYWFTALRDYVSLNARGNASRAGRKVVFRIPEKTLLEYNEDALQVVPIYEQFWPTLTIAAASFLGTELWKDDDVSPKKGKKESGEEEEEEDHHYSLILGVCLQCLAHSPTGDTRDKIDLTKATRCFTVLRWLFSNKYVNENRIPVELAVEIVSILANGLGSIESGTETMSTIAVALLACLISEQNLDWLKSCFIEEATTGFDLCHTLIEYCARIIHYTLKTKDTISSSVELQPMAVRTIINALEMLTTVTLCLPTEARSNYRASLLKLVFILHTSLLRVENDTSLLVVRALQKFVHVLIKCDKEIDNAAIEERHNLKENAVLDLYESLCSNLLEKIKEENSIGGLNLQSSHAYGSLQCNLISLVKLCRENFQSKIFFDTIDLLKNALNPTNPNTIIFGGLCCIQYLMSDKNASSRTIHSFGALSASNLLALVGTEIVLLLSTGDNDETDDEVKTIAVKMLVQAGLLSSDQNFANFLIEILAAFQHIDRSKLLAKLAATYALQLLKTGQARFKIAVQNLSPALQIQLQTGLKGVM